MCIRDRIETEDQETGIIIEIKYAETGNLEAVSEEALKQIEDLSLIHIYLFFWRLGC